MATETRKLEGPPGTPLLYGRAALGAVPGAGLLPFVGGRGERLPDLELQLEGARVDRDRLAEYCRVCGFTPRQQVLDIVVPHALPTLFTGLRLGFTKAWLSLVVVELVASSEGLGFLIVYGRQLFQLDLVMAAVIVVGAVGYAFDRALDALERRVRRGARELA